MYTLDLARAHQRDLRREATREGTGIEIARATRRLRRLVSRPRRG
jgi:hypothetical protein